MIAMGLDQRMPKWSPMGYEPTIRADWLNGHGTTDESCGGIANDATKNAEGTRCAQQPASGQKFAGKRTTIGGS